MRNLILFLFRNGSFFLFVVLEIFCFYLIVENNRYHNASFLNSTNYVVGSANELTSDISSYFRLRKDNQQLISLLDSLQEANNNLLAKIDGDSITRLNSQVPESDTTLRYKFFGAKIISKSTNRQGNYFTLNRGSGNGVEEDMGVIAGNKIVGKVSNVSQHFSIVMPVIHNSFRVPAKILKNGGRGSLIWEGPSLTKARLTTVPHSYDAQTGDTIVTAQVSSIFPENIVIGTIETVGSPEGQNYHDITVTLSTDFNSLQYVQVVEYPLSEEQKQIEKEFADE